MTKRKPTQPLGQAFYKLQKRWGQQALQFASSLKTTTAAVPTGFANLDESLCADGAACGQITVLMGVPTSGATTIAYHLIAGGQGKEAFAVWIDLSATFDPEYAVHCGVHLPRLLVVRTSDAAQGVEIARDIVLANVVPLIVIDALGLANFPPGRALDRLADVLLRASSAVVVLVDKETPSLEAAAQTWLTFERQAWQIERGQVRGYSTQVTIHKDKPRILRERVVLDITLGEHLL